MGTHNIYPERDGIVRQYSIARDDYGWLLPSLPLRIAQKSGWPVPEADSILLNWRGAPFTYRYITFSDVYGDFQSKKRQRPPDEFTGKIVLIGSTAPSLFDIKATSMARQFPGVEVLATAIDNLKHADYLRVPKSRLPIFLLTILVIWGTAIAFVRHVALAKLDRVFGSAQIVLMAVTFASINFTSWYVNLTAPITLGFIFFSIARVYAHTTEKALERNVVAETYARAGSWRAVLLVINLSQNDRAPTASIVDKLRRQLEQLAKLERSVDQIKGEQKGVWSLLNGTLVVSWIHAIGDDTVARQIAVDVDQVKNGLPSILEAVRGRRPVSYAVIEHEEVLETGEQAGASWRRTLAHALGKAMAGPANVKGVHDV